MLPEYSSILKPTDAYDAIFLGFPIWGGDIPPIVQNFLMQHDFAQKTLIPFCTYDTSGFSSSLNTLAELQPESVILEGLALEDERVSECAEEVAQ